MTAAAPSLVALTVRRIVIFSTLAMLAQLVGVVLQYWSDDQTAERYAIEMETEALARGVSDRNGQATFRLPDDLRARYGEANSGYFVRVRTAEGRLLSNCGGECDVLFPPLDLKPLIFWMRQAQPGRPLQVAGGRVATETPEPVMIEIAIVDDRDGVMRRVLAREIIDHMVLPMSLMLILVLGATILSVVQMLRPVQRAARQLERLDPRTDGARLSEAGMPREIAGFMQAVNAAFDRIVALMRSQKLLTSSITHAVRTPLAVARLQLEKIADPLAREVERDLDALNHLVEQLTDLARIEGAPLAATALIDPATLAERVVGDLAALVYASGKSIELTERDAMPFAGHPALIENALRNLVENAVRHTGEGASIRLEVGPGASFCVRDDGDRLGKASVRTSPSQSATSASEKQGLGLKIVDRIAAVHCARFEWTRVEGVGVAARLLFPPGSSCSPAMKFDQARVALS
jgi:signal transduction histidine kinase